MPERFGFISTRFAGTDGVSLESAKWAQVLWEDFHKSFWYGGRLDRAPDMSLCVPEAHFGHPEIRWLNDRIWGRTRRSRLVSARIRDLSEYLKGTLYEFVRSFDISILVLENVLTIPLHLPLGVAVTEFMAETRVPAIAHHHDFYWERHRFQVNAVSDYLEMAFPPRERKLQHVVINQAAQEELSWRKGISSMRIPNVLDFEHPPNPPDAYAAQVREEIGLAPDDIMILQPTRVIPRKGIEHAIQLVEMLRNPRCKLVISHEAGDEGMAYAGILREMARESGVDLRFISTRIGDRRQVDNQGHKVFTLWDLYPQADLVTYPSLYEGFGNAFLEAVYFRKPLLINRYAIFGRDIEPFNFRVVVMEGFVTRETTEEVRHLLEDEQERRATVNHNYAVAQRFFSYAVLRRNLLALVMNVSGL
ncbi:MAG: glycosyltransferase family 4 protein [Planctomycetota bacterium]